MTYAEALDFIHGARGKKVGLENMRALLRALGNPERDFPSIHVAGTNGKGSICAFLHACLREKDYKTGLYTSPYLQRYNERMRLQGLPIPDGELAALVSEIAAPVEALRARGIEPTEFEIGTALAFLYFSRSRVDIAVIEVGLGGRYDPTNVIKPVLSIIGSIGRDHMHFLGEDIASIAYEKAGIIKPGRPVVLYPQGETVRRVVREASEANGSELIDLADYALRFHGNPATAQVFDVDGPHICLRELEISLPGEYQSKNALTAAMALDHLSLADEITLRKGLQKAWWPGRLEWQGNILLDGAHNEQGVDALASYAAWHTKPEATALIVGITGDKDTRPMVRRLAGLADTVIATRANNPRALDASAVAQAFAQAGKGAREASGCAEALREARQSGAEHIIVAGSLYLIGEMRDVLGLPVPVIP